MFYSGAHPVAVGIEALELWVWLEIDVRIGARIPTLLWEATVWLQVCLACAKLTTATPTYVHQQWNTKRLQKSERQRCIAPFRTIHPHTPAGFWAEGQRLVRHRLWACKPVLAGHVLGAHPL